MGPKEEWVKATMESLDGIHRLEPNPFLYEQVMQRLKNPSNVAKIISIRPALVWRVAASVALLIGLNVFTVVHYTKTGSSVQTASQTFASEYFSYLSASE